MNPLQEQPSPEQVLGQALLQLQRILLTQQERQQRTARRVSLLYKISLVAFAVLVLSMSFMIILMATQLPLLTSAIDQMNTHFAAITTDMEVMRRGMYAMQHNVDSLPSIVQNMDTIHANEPRRAKNSAAHGPDAPRHARHVRQCRRSASVFQRDGP